MKSSGPRVLRRVGPRDDVLPAVEGRRPREPIAVHLVAERNEERRPHRLRRVRPLVDVGVPLPGEDRVEPEFIRAFELHQVFPVGIVPGRPEDERNRLVRGHDLRLYRREMSLSPEAGKGDDCLMLTHLLLRIPRCLPASRCLPRHRNRCRRRCTRPGLARPAWLLSAGALGPRLLPPASGRNPSGPPDTARARIPAVWDAENGWRRIMFAWAQHRWRSHPRASVPPYTREGTLTEAVRSSFPQPTSTPRKALKMDCQTTQLSSGR